MANEAYAVDGTQTVTTPADTVLGITGGTSIRPEIFEILIYSNDTPADNSIEWTLQRNTAAGTSTSVTPSPLDSDAPASTTTAGENHTAEPTYTAGEILWRFALNLRASHRWVADPEGRLMVPATANNGLGMQPLHASATPEVQCTMHFFE